MVSLYLGPYGYGKSTQIIEDIKRDYENGIHSFLIVPEQQTLVAERMLSSKLPAKAQLYTEATNFTRLANSVFRKMGGLKYNYVTKSGQNLIMYRTLCELRGKGLLKHFNVTQGREKSFVSLFLQAVGELKTYGITPNELEAARDRLDKESATLKNRLDDMITVWVAYDEILNGLYDDPYDDILMLERKLSDTECNFFDGCNVYIDSFYGFTKTQFAVVKRIIEKAKNVTIALDCPKDADSTTMQYVKIAGTKEKILGYCGKNVFVKEFTKDYKHTNQELKYVCDNLWKFDAPAIESAGAISLAEASDEFEECEYVCAKILELIQSPNERYGQIAIITRNSSTYQGIIDFCLDKYGIPYYLSVPSKLTSKPVIKMVFSALRAISDYRSEDIVSYLKCGYTDISNEDICLFEDYLYKWGIYGKKFTNEDYWSASPDGFVKETNEDRKTRLARIQGVREKVLKSLSVLKEAFSSGKTVKECCNAVYELLEAHKVRDKLLDEIAKGGDEAQELSQIWSLLIESLEEIAFICNKISCDSETFLSLLSYSMMDAKIGTIPTGEDKVTIADASLVRAQNIRHVFILGANEGEFPAIIKDDTFFSDSDKIALENVDINLSATTEERGDDEYLFFKNSIAVASESATVTALKTSLNGEKRERSIGFERLISLLTSITVADISDKDLADRIYTEKMAKELLGSASPELYEAIVQETGEDVSEKSFTNTNDSIGKEAASAVYKSRIYLSKSKLESFKKCHLGYYCSDVLKLKDSEKIKFSSNLVGDLIHHIFEEFLKNDAKDKEYKEEEIWEKVSCSTDEFTHKLCGSYAISNKMKHMFSRLKLTVCVFVDALLKERKASKLQPEYMELNIMGDGENAPLPTEFKVDDRHTVVMTGIADRVDVKRDSDTGTTYIKIVDYKSGSHSFSKKDLERGYDHQMLFYLYALCNMKKSEFKSKLMGLTERVKPAGIVYLTYKIDKTDSKKEIDLSSEEAIKNEQTELMNKTSRSGLELDSPHTLSDNEAYRLSKGYRVTEEDFDSYFELVKNNIIEVGKSMLSGDASANPDTDMGACNYCKNGAICRRRVKSVRFN